MDRQGFRSMLEARQTPPDRLEPALDLAERFERFSATYSQVTSDTAWDFSRTLIAEGQNTIENLITLARYGWFTRNNAVLIAFLELLDGCEAQENLHVRVAERHGEALRDQVFSGIGLAPLGIPTPEKPAYMHPVIERLERSIGEQACRDLLSDSLRDLPDELYAGERELFLSSNGVDDYLVRKKQKFMERMLACQRNGQLFFAQEVTPQALDYIQNEPEMGGGVRDGNVVYETKIPFLTPQFLAETDPVMKRYFYCHCPWSREAIRSGAAVSPIFCNCSAGFHRKPWQAALGQSVQVDVLESVLKGDDRCRFAIHLPDGTH